MRAVILQPQFFPWRGVFEQMQLADVYVHLDDVAPPQGRSFLNRVQIKTAGGPRWMTVPVLHGATRILDMQIDETQSWRNKHLKSLQQHYAAAPHGSTMLDLVRNIYDLPTHQLCEMNVQSLEKISRLLGIQVQFRRASEIPSQKRGADRLLEILEVLGADTYLTGHGALNYLKTDPFESRGIQVEIMDYRRSAYPQLFEHFDPHVSILDLIANTTQSDRYLDAVSSPWRDYERVRKISA